MPYKNIEDKKKHNKEYYEKNKEKRNEYMKKYNKEYKLKYPEKTTKYARIGKWRNRGVISEDYNKLYEYYLSIEECENCCIELNQDEATRKCLDHCHQTGEFRQILCKVCNTTRDQKYNELGQFI
tara:strand:+ start:8 stop:382 length:375 start_codon:yes stop_codon:yes gene_type:complete